MAKKPKILIYIKRNYPSTMSAMQSLKGQLKPAIAIYNTNYLLIPANEAPDRPGYGHCWAVTIEHCVICEGELSTLPRTS